LVQVFFIPFCSMFFHPSSQNQALLLSSLSVDVSCVILLSMPIFVNLSYIHI
jgi:hypothetical protein